MPVQSNKYPRSGKEQRKLERIAAKTREEGIARGLHLPQICGYSYTRRKPANAPPDWQPTEAICMRNSGANTSHPNQGFCDYHEVELELALDGQGAQTQAARQFAWQQATFFGRKPIGPAEALMEEIQRSAYIVEWIEAQMEELRQQGVSNSGIFQQYDIKNGYQPSVWATLHKQEREFLLKATTAAIKAGLEERKVQIAEQQGRLIVAMMMAFINDPQLGLNPDQLMRAPALMRKHLLALPNENPNPPAIINAHSEEVA
jgi:hypothetical protein